VLLPGMDGTGALFSEFIAMLPATFEAVAVSYPTERYLPYSELEGIVRAACPVSEPYMLVAESFSTPLAIQYAATNPAKLEGLVLCAGFASSPVKGWWRFLGSLFAPLVFRIPLPNLVAKLWLVGPDAPTSLVMAVRDAISSVQPWVLAARLRAVLGSDVRGAVGKIGVPMLYLQAKQDRLVSASCLEIIQRSKPDVAVVTLDGPHLLLQKHPLKAAEVVMEFARHALQKQTLPTAAG
jgi:pimeloyl-[acyl-carrier protein] methyl ester esterase